MKKCDCDRIIQRPVLTSKKHLKALFKDLTVKEKLIYASYKLLSFSQIGKLIRMSKEGVRKVYMKARKKL